jgi:hypothetical protein
MTKQQFKQQQRQQRIEANGGTGVRVGKIMLGELYSTFDNSHIWQLRNVIASEVIPEIRKRQLAWNNN